MIGDSLLSEEIRAGIPGRVQAGVTLLDVREPGWVDQVNLKSLDLGCCLKCVFGQLFGHYFDGSAKLGVRAYSNESAELGFCGFGPRQAGSWDDSVSAHREEHRLLTRAWRDLIMSRRALRDSEDLGDTLDWSEATLAADYERMVGGVA